MGLSIIRILFILIIYLNMIIINDGLFMKTIRKKFFGKNNNEEMMLFPNVGFQRDENNWRLNVHGWRFYSSKKNRLLGESSSTLGQRLARLFASSEQIVYYNDTFQRDRLEPFMVEDAQFEYIQINISSKYNFTTKTDDEGQFRTSFIISNNDVQKLKTNQQILSYQAIGDNGDISEGNIYLLERRGLSIISDIDDTIKISEVIDKIRLIANTFIHSFRVVEGMPEIYQKWKQKYNCSIHYLSAMPDQLYTVTKQFIQAQKFPDGTFHMRHFRWSSTSIFNFIHSMDTKMHKINHLRYFIFNSLRTLILIGDSGEHDPEIYAFIARKYPKRVHHIFIRAVKGETKDDQRFINAFQDIPNTKWTIFTNPFNELPEDLKMK